MAHIDTSFKGFTSDDYVVHFLDFEGADNDIDIAINFRSIAGLNLSLKRPNVDGSVEPIKLTLERGVSPDLSKLYTWFKAVRERKARKIDVLIILGNITPDSEEQPNTTGGVVWTVKNAFPVKIIVPKFEKVKNTDPAVIEAIELIAEDLKVQYFKKDGTHS